MNVFSQRPTVILDVPVPGHLHILRPEHTVLRFGKKTTMDVGALCYLRRESTGVRMRRQAYEGRRVCLNSLCANRVAHIKKFIAFISDEVRYGKRKFSTIHNLAQHFSRFVAWADENGHSDVLDNAQSTRSAIVAYAAHIKCRVMEHKISADFGAVVQQKTFSLISEFLEIDNLTRGINLLRREGSSNSTIPPDGATQGKTLSIAEALFEGLSKLVLDEKLYPFSISMPPHLNYPNDQMWIFPTTTWCQPPNKLRSSSEGVFNYCEGRLITPEEASLSKKYIGKRKRVTEMLSKAERLLTSSNEDMRHGHRRFMAIMAHNSFLHLFIARTGINWEQAVSLKWDNSDTQKLSTIRQRFRSIKHRAGGKVVYFQLPLAFMPSFKRFLDLRKYLLESSPEFDSLFFTMGNRASGAPTSIRSSMQIAGRFLQRIDTSLIPPGSRAWRAAKGDWLLTRTDLSTTAQLLQNTEQTVRAHYATSSVEAHQLEMSEFFNRIVLTKRSGAEGFVEGALGSCSSYGQAKAISSSTPVVVPSCKSPEAGCLYCDKYKVHADEVDVRKLVSCRYCLARVSHLSGFAGRAKDIISRIQRILDEIALLNNALVVRIENEVEEGELDFYWAKKFDMLLRLRLVNEFE